MGSGPSLPRSSPASTPSPGPRPSPPETSSIPLQHPRQHSRAGGGFGDGCGAEHSHPSPASVGSAETESRGQSEATGSGDGVYHSRGRGSPPCLLSGVSRRLQAVGTGKCQCPRCPSPPLALAGQGAGAEGRDPKSVLWHGPTAEARARPPCHVGGVPRGAGGESHPGPPLTCPGPLGHPCPALAA